MSKFGNKLPRMVQVPDAKKQQIALLVCDELNEILSWDYGEFEWNLKEPLCDLFENNAVIGVLIDENLSLRMNKKLNLTETNYEFEKLTVEQLIDVVYARYNDLPLPDFTRPTLIQRFKICFGLDKQKTRE